MIVMYPCAGFGYGLWWIFPLIMIVMMVLCFFMMRGRMGSMRYRKGIRSASSRGEDAADSAFDALKKRYARGEINREEYEEKKRVITGHN
jgi:putative membrane protein